MNTLEKLKELEQEVEAQKGQKRISEATEREINEVVKKWQKERRGQRR